MPAAISRRTSGRSSPRCPPCGFSSSRTGAGYARRSRQGHKPSGSWEAISRFRPLPAWSAGCERGDSRPPYREWQSQQSCLWKQKTPGNSPGSGRRAALGEFLSVWQARSCGQAGSSIASPLLRRRSTKYCGLHTPAERLPEAGFHCGRYHAFPGSALLAGRIHRTAFRRFGKQRRQPQTAAGCAEQS